MSRPSVVRGWHQTIRRILPAKGGNITRSRLVSVTVNARKRESKGNIGSRSQEGECSGASTVKEQSRQGGEAVDARSVQQPESSGQPGNLIDYGQRPPWITLRMMEILYHGQVLNHSGGGTQSKPKISCSLRIGTRLPCCDLYYMKPTLVLGNQDMEASTPGSRILKG